METVQQNIIESNYGETSPLEDSPQMPESPPVAESPPIASSPGIENSPPRVENYPHENAHNDSVGSQEKLSRSKLVYEADPEDAELRQKLIEAKMARKKTEDDAKVMLNRLLLLKNEEQKVV